MRTEEAYMIFAGISSADLDVRMRSAPTIGAPVQRITEQVEIFGRDGKTMETDGAYSPITIAVKLATNTSRLSEIRRWLMMCGDLVFGDNIERCYKNARVIKEIKFNPVGIGRTGRIEFDVTFQCDPMMQAYGTGCITLHDGMQITNPGDFGAHPLLRITGAGDITFERDDQSQTITIIRDADGVYIDCETGFAFEADAGDDPFAYTFRVIRPEMARGDLIALEPGAYTVEMDDTITEALMLPRWRWA